MGENIMAEKQPLVINTTNRVGVVATRIRSDEFGPGWRYTAAVYHFFELDRRGGQVIHRSVDNLKGKVAAKHALDVVLEIHDIHMRDYGISKPWEGPPDTVEIRGIKYSVLATEYEAPDKK